MIILGVIVAIAVVIAAFMLLSAEDTNLSKLDILGNGTIGENGTLNVKLSNEEGVALKDKEVHVTVKNSKGKVVFENSAKTYVNGVANVKIENVSAGEYEVNVTFDGDENYTACSISEKLIIAQGVVEDTEENDDVDTANAVDTTSDSSQSSSSYRSSSYSSSNSDSSDDGSSDNYYDEDGNVVEPTIDEDGNPTYDDEEN